MMKTNKCRHYKRAHDELIYFAYHCDEADDYTRTMCLYFQDKRSYMRKIALMKRYGADFLPYTITPPHHEYGYEIKHLIQVQGGEQ